MALSTFDNFKARAFVIIFLSQLDKVIGLQFLISFMFLHSFGNSVMIDSLCEGGISPFTQLNFHASRVIGPAIIQIFLYTLYVIQSDPGAESEHVFRAASSSA